jgi:hypothetical protein
MALVEASVMFVSLGYGVVYGTEVLRTWLRRDAAVEIRFAERKGSGVDEPGDTKERKVRLHEIEWAFQSARKDERFNRWSSNASVFGQYIVGGALTSQYVVAEMGDSRSVFALAGLLVIASSAAQKHFRFEAKASQARRRMYLLQRLRRSVEDDLFAIDEGAPDAPTLRVIRSRVSDVLATIEAPEELEPISPAPNARQKGKTPKAPS